MSAAPRYARARERQDKVSVATKIFQGIGALPDVFKNFAFHTFLLFFYSQVLGLPPVRASFAIGAALVVDAVIDPVVGTFSDNLKSRLGRRHLLMYTSILPLGLALYLAFTPPAGASENVLFLWLFAFAVLTNMAMSIYVIPWTALYAEFSDDYAERTTIVTYRYALGLAGGIVFTFSVWTFIFPSTHAFHPGQLNPAGYHLFAPVVALAVMGTIFATTFLTQREVPYLLQPTRQVSHRDAWRVIREMLGIFTNRDFVLLFAGALVTAGINGTTGALSIYMQTYFWGLTPENLRWFAIAVVGAVAAFFTVGPFQRRLDKKAVLITCFVLLIVDGVAGVGLRLLGLLPPNGSPILIGIMIANETTRAFLNTTVGIMFASMLADTLDLQELRTSRRQEGVFAAALSFSGKATTGVGTVMAGLILQYAVHWPAKVAPGAVDPALVTRLGVIVGMMIPMLLFLSISLSKYYRLTREVHADIRAQLAVRRAAPVDTESAERADFANAVLASETTT
ncbi:MAG: MFS transporter [Alphaproteobacteria bacterium]|nr:MFS transporter [Alphaproteobacteria bacterium]